RAREPEENSRRECMSMRHLSVAELVDIAEGVRRASEIPHLQACDACRDQLLDLQATMAAVREIDVPPPSPLFWDHLSARVHEAVRTDGAPVPVRLGDRLWRPASVGAFAVLALIAAVGVWLVVPHRGIAPEAIDGPTAVVSTTAAPAGDALDASD